MPFESYRDGYSLGIQFVARMNGRFKNKAGRACLAYVRWHLNKYNQTDSDRGFVDAVLLACGA